MELGPGELGPGEGIVAIDNHDVVVNTEWWFGLSTEQFLAMLVYMFWNFRVRALGCKPMDFEAREAALNSGNFSLWKGSDPRFARETPAV